MPANNRDKGLPQTPAIGSDDKILILTNNFFKDTPIVNPILWGPNQPWVDINTYKKPTNWRAKELLSIPRVSRLVLGRVDPCLFAPTSGHFPLGYLCKSFGGTGITANGVPYKIADGFPPRISDTFNIDLDTLGQPRTLFRNGYWRVLRYFDISVPANLFLNPPENFVRMEATGRLDGFGQFFGTGIVVSGGDATLTLATDGFDNSYSPTSPDGLAKDLVFIELSSDGTTWSPFPESPTDWPGST